MVPMSLISLPHDALQRLAERVQSGPSSGARGERAMGLLVVGLTAGAALLAALLTG